MIEVPPTTDRIAEVLDEILTSVHPLMAEALYLAAIPAWYDEPLFAAMRQKEDGRNTGLIERLAQYSFVIPLPNDSNDTHPSFSLRPHERELLQQRWLAQDPTAYVTAHQRALAYFQANPDPNSFAQAQILIYHGLFAEPETAVALLIQQFRAYSNERQLAAIERLLNMVENARLYLQILQSPRLGELDTLIVFLRARLLQMRHQWQESLKLLAPLQKQEHLPPRYKPYIQRAYGYALVHDGKYVEAIEQYDAALAEFDAQAAQNPDDHGLLAEQAYTLIAKGDAYADLAASARGYHEKINSRPSRGRWVTAVLDFFISFPLLLYLSFTVGRNVWTPRFWLILREFDWMIARIFVNAAQQYRRADPLLEKFGESSEAVTADEKTAALFLRMGDTKQAYTLYDRLLNQKTMDGRGGDDYRLGDYRRAIIRVGLGQANLRLGRFAIAREQLEATLPVLQLYEEDSLQAEVHALLGETCWEQGELETAVTHFSQALHTAKEMDNITGATEIAEHLQEIAQEQSVTAEQKAHILQTADSLEHRRYLVHYRHSTTVLFQRGFLLFFAILVFLIPLSVINLDTSSALSPQIAFRVAPLLKTNADGDILPDLNTQLSQGVNGFDLRPIASPNVFLAFGVEVLVAYMLLSATVGLLVIYNTPIRTVQQVGAAHSIHLDPQGIQIGEGEEMRRIPWADIQELIQADTSMGLNYMIDNSRTVIHSLQGQLKIRGSTDWYLSLIRRIRRQLPATTPQQDLSYSILYSKAGFVYAVTFVLLLLIAFLGNLRGTEISLPGNSLQLIHIYPFLYLGLFVPMVRWLIFRPAHILWRTDTNTRRAWALTLFGVVIFGLRVLVSFRPWLTIPDIYPPLTAVAFIAISCFAIWRMSVAPKWEKLLSFLLTLFSLYVLSLYIAREVFSYQFLVLGHLHRDKALSGNVTADVRDQEIAQAIGDYTHAISIAQTAVLGIDGRAAINDTFGFPSLHQITWLSAVNNRAGLYAEQRDYVNAIFDYTVVIGYTDSKASAYASRAIAYQGLGTLKNVANNINPTLNVQIDAYTLARNDFNIAIALSPNDLNYYLWRGVASHALGNLDLALADYQKAVQTEGVTPIKDMFRAKAYIGQGWVYFSQNKSDLALQAFQQALSINDRSTEALTGLGYVNYRLQNYDSAKAAWEQAITQQPNNPSHYTSLGTLYWRLGTLDPLDPSRISDRCTNSSLSLAEKQASAALLEKAIATFDQSLAIPGQTAQDLAFTYRTRAQVEYLLRNCPGYQQTDVLERAITSYTEAIQQTPDEAVYWLYRARLTYALWFNSPKNEGVAIRSRLFDALDDVHQALLLNPVEDGDYRPAYWEAIIGREAVERTLDQGDKAFNQTQYSLAFDLYELVATQESAQATAAFKASLAAFAQQNWPVAKRWFAEGLERGQATHDVAALQEGLVSLQTFVLSQKKTIFQTQAVEFYRLFDQSDVSLTIPANPEVAFAFALLDVVNNSEKLTPALYAQGLSMAVQMRDFTAVQAAARNLAQFLNTHPEIKLAQVYWPLLGEEATRTTVPTEISQADLYWRYRAEFGFRLVVALFNTPRAYGHEAEFEPIYASLIADIERAARLDPAKHQVWRDFFVDANLGWHFLQRGNTEYAAGQYDLALADYTEATKRIRPLSDNATNDLTNATFRAGLAALQLGQLSTAHTWYDAGELLLLQYDSNNDALQNALSDLADFVAQKPHLKNQIDQLTSDLNALQK